MRARAAVLLGLLVLPSVLAAAPDAPAATAAARWLRSRVGDEPTYANLATVTWLAPGLAPLGEDVRTWSGAVERWRAAPLAHVNPDGANPCADRARGVFALAAMGEDARAFGGVDLVQEMVDVCYRGDGVWDDPATDQDRDLVNNDAYILLALRAVGTPTTDPRVQATVAALAARQHADGGWSFGPGPTSLVDDTAGVTTALLSVLPPTADAPARGLRFLETAQLPSGGFLYLNRESANSVAWVIEAALAAGEDPDAGRWAKPAGSAVDALLAFRIETGPDAGAFRSERGSNAADGWATREAMRALAGGALPVAVPRAAFEAPAGAGAGRPATLHDRSTVAFGRIAHVAWDLGDGTGATGPTATHTWTTPGSHRVVMRATTDRGVSRVVEGSVDVAPAPPVALLLAPTTHRNVTVLAEAVAEGRAEYRFVWGDGTATAWQAGPLARHAWDRLGAFDVRVDVRDPAGSIRSAIATIVVENAPPVLAAPARVDADRTRAVALAASAADPDGPAPALRWTFADGAVLHGASVSRRFETLGASEVRVEALDADGGLAEARVVVDVANLAPTLALDVPDFARVGEVATLAARVADADGPEPSVAWPDLGLAGARVSWTPQAVGETAVRAVARDADGSLVAASGTVLVVAADAPAPAPPRPTLATRLLPAGPAVGDDVALALDVAGGRPPYALRVLREGVEVPVADGVADLGRADEPFEWIAEARDAEGEVARAAGVVAPRSDAPPTAKLATSADGARVVADASGSADPERGPLAFRFDWGDGASTDWSPSALATRAYAAEGAYAVAVEVRDEAGLVDRASSVVDVVLPRAETAPRVVFTYRPAPEEALPAREAGALAAASRPTPLAAWVVLAAAVAAAVLPRRGRAATGPSRARTPPRSPPRGRG